LKVLQTRVDKEDDKKGGIDDSMMFLSKKKIEQKGKKRGREGENQGSRQEGNEGTTLLNNTGSIFSGLYICSQCSFMYR
jgi:hypothetical protein